MSALLMYSSCAAGCLARVANSWADSATVAVSIPAYAATTTQQALRSLEWIGRAATLVVCGPSGTGRSCFIEALGHLVIDRGKTVAWHILETQAALIHRHDGDDSVNRAISKLARTELAVIADGGLLPIAADAAEAMFRAVDAAYEKRPIPLSSSAHSSGLDELMPKMIATATATATATVKRLQHHALVLSTDGQDSYRLAPATAGKEVTALTGNQPHQPLSVGGFVAASGEKSMAVDTIESGGIKARYVAGLISRRGGPGDEGICAACGWGHDLGHSPCGGGSERAQDHECRVVKGDNRRYACSDRRNRREAVKDICMLQASKGEERRLRCDPPSGAPRILAVQRANVRTLLPAIAFSARKWHRVQHLRTCGAAGRACLAGGCDD